MKRFHLHIFSKLPLTVEGIKNVMRSKCITVSFHSDISRMLKTKEHSFPNIYLIDDSYVSKNEIMNLLDKMFVSFPERRIILYTHSKDILYLKKLINLGARGILHAKATKEKIIEAIELVGINGIFIDYYINFLIAKHEIKEETTKNAEFLSKREEEILQLIAKGFKNKDIAQKLFITQGTVEVHKFNLIKKLKLKSTTELTIFAAFQKF